MESAQQKEANLMASNLAEIPISTANNRLTNCYGTISFTNSNNERVYTNRFPAGYRFIPEDEELIVHYLKNKIMKKPLPCNIIQDANLYKHNPQDLTGNFSDNGIHSWYFFTPRERKYKNGSRPNRAAGNGYWKATGADKFIYYNNELVGAKKALVFYEGKPPKGNKTNWIMQEYRLDQPPRVKTCANDMRLDDWVLCRIYKKDEKYLRHKRKRIYESCVTENPTAARLRKSDDELINNNNAVLARLRKSDDELINNNNAVLARANTNPGGTVYNKNEFDDVNELMMNQFGTCVPQHFGNTFSDNPGLIDSYQSNFNFNAHDLASSSFSCGESSSTQSYPMENSVLTSNSIEFRDDFLGIDDVHFNFDSYSDPFPSLDDVLNENPSNNLIDPPLPRNFGQINLTGDDAGTGDDIDENSMSENLGVSPQGSLPDGVPESKMSLIPKKRDKRKFS
ncbi:NAC transcription factor 29-like [Forsythia ovata]|uniref:NAC transcription factor 29-like n=1 Tax=Forsythia ovata TaxID=205694 RepID=A0ABD1T323_9LAMI